MGNTWQKPYAELKDYITNHPNIEIGANVIVLPDDVRKGFYDLFNSMRLSFILDNFGDRLEGCRVLTKNYKSISSGITESLGLERIDVRTDFNFFLNDPTDALIQVLFDRVFDLLKGKIDLVSFETESRHEVQSALKSLFEYGYRLWAVLSLTKIMMPSKLYRVPTKNEFIDPDLMDEAVGPGLYESNLPDAEEAKQINFEQQSNRISFIVPQVLVHSTRLGCYVALHTNFTGAHFRARSISENREWRKIPEIIQEFGRSNLWPDLSLYASRELKDLTLVADSSRIMKPEIIADVMEESNWYENGGLELVKRHHRILKPKLGTYVICREAVPEAAIIALKTEPIPLTQSSGETPADIHLLNVGYDIAKLEPVVEQVGQLKKQ